MNRIDRLTYRMEELFFGFIFGAGALLAHLNPVILVFKVFGGLFGLLWSAGKSTTKLAISRLSSERLKVNLDGADVSKAQPAQRSETSESTHAQGQVAQAPIGTEGASPLPDTLVVREAVSAASRIITIPLEASTGLPIGVAWIYLYDKEGRARRLLKFTQPDLARLICRGKETRYFFKDVPYDPKVGTREIVQELTQEIRKLLDRSRDKPQREQAAKAKAVQPKPVKVEAPTAPAVEPPKREVPVQPIMPPVQVVAPPIPAQAPKPAFERRVAGQAYVGRVVSAGMTERSGRDGTYSTFCLTLNDGECEQPLFGAELARQVKDMGIQPGEQIKVVFMRTEKVEVEGRKPYTRNLYQITRVGGK